MKALRRMAARYALVDHHVGMRAIRAQQAHRGWGHPVFYRAPRGMLPRRSHTVRPGYHVALVGLCGECPDRRRHTPVYMASDKRGRPCGNGRGASTRDVTLALADRYPHRRHQGAGYSHCGLGRRRPLPSVGRGMRERLTARALAGPRGRYAARPCRVSMRRTGWWRGRLLLSRDATGDSACPAPIRWGRATRLSDLTVGTALIPAGCAPGVPGRIPPCSRRGRRSPWPAPTARRGAARGRRRRAPASPRRARRGRPW